jgi:hypothetical protein
MALGAYAWAGGRPIDWGSGGPDRWPGARPYFTPSGVQDHLSFRIFDWYLAVAEDVLGARLPIIILGGGALPKSSQPASNMQNVLERHAAVNLEIAHLVHAGDEALQGNEPVPAEVLAVNFWLLSTNKTSTFRAHAWYQPDGGLLPVALVYRDWVASLKGGMQPEQVDISFLQASSPQQQETAPSAPKQVVTDGRVDAPSGAGQSEEGVREKGAHRIDHYVLLPLYAWGEAHWDLDIVRKVFKDMHPTIGFSLAEASLARRVTIFGGEGAFSESALKMLRSAGCQVERLTADGTLIATD